MPKGGLSYGMPATPVVGMLRGLNRAIKSAPANIGLFAETLLGDRRPITETRLDKDALGVLRIAAADAMARRQEAVNSAQHLLASLEKQPEDAFFGWSQEGGKRKNYTKADRLADARQQLAAAQRPATIQYSNYPRNWGDADLAADGWLQTLNRSRSDPSYRAMTTIGRARLEQDAEGNTYVVDTYDFNHRKTLDADTAFGNAVTFLRGLTSPGQFGSFIGSYMAPQEDNPRPVRLNLGAVKPRRKKK